MTAQVLPKAASEVRQLIRCGQWRGVTSGVAPGHVLACFEGRHCRPTGRSREAPIGGRAPASGPRVLPSRVSGRETGVSAGRASVGGGAKVRELPHREVSTEQAESAIRSGHQPPGVSLGGPLQPFPLRPTRGPCAPRCAACALHYLAVFRL